jgi:hypothetical protein
MSGNLKNFSDFKEESKRKLKYLDFDYIRANSINYLYKLVKSLSLNSQLSDKLYNYNDKIINKTTKKNGGRFINERIYDYLIDEINRNKPINNARKLIKKYENQIKKYQDKIKKLEIETKQYVIKKKEQPTTYIHITYKAVWQWYRGGQEDRQSDQIIDTYHEVSGNYNIDQFEDYNQSRIAEDLQPDTSAELIEFTRTTYGTISKSDFENHYKPIEERPIRSVSVKRYGRTKADDLNILLIDGNCLSHAFVTHYKEYIPSLTIEKCNQIMNEACKLLCKIEHKHHIFHYAKYFFMYYKISHYALDIKNKLFSKFIYPSYNYPAFVCYVIDEHLHVVKNKKFRH